MENKKAKINYVLTNIIRTVVPLLVFPLCIKLIGAKNFGQIAGEYSIALLMGFIVDFSTSIYATAALAKGSLDEQKRTFISIFVLKSLILLGLISIFIALEKLKLYDTSITQLFLIVGVGLTTILDVIWIFIIKKKFKILLRYHVIGFGTAFLIAYLMHYLFNFHLEIITVFLIILPLLATNALMSFGSFILLELTLSDLIKFTSMNFIITEIKRGKLVFVSQLVSAMYSSGGPIFLNSFGEPSHAGIWLILNRLATGAGNFAILPAKSIISDIYMAWSRNKSIFCSLLRIEFKKFIILITILAVGLLSFHVNFNQWFLGGEYSVNYFDIFLIVLWMIAPFFAYFVTAHLIYFEEQYKLLFLSICTLFTFILVVAPAYAKFGLTGFICSMVFSQVYTLILFLKRI